MAEYEDDKENELWNYTAWELFRTSIKVFLWGAWQFLKPRKLYQRLHPLSEVEVNKLKEQAITQVKIKAAEELGGKPNDYEVREVSGSRDILVRM